MVGEITEKNPDLLGKPSGKRKDSLVRTKNRVHLEGRMEAERGKRKKELQGEYVGRSREGLDLVGREYVYEVRILDNSGVCIKWNENKPIFLYHSRLKTSLQ